MAIVGTTDPTEFLQNLNIKIRIDYDLMHTVQKLDLLLIKGAVNFPILS